MGTMLLDDDLKRELDDSGCVQDEPYLLKGGENGMTHSVQLLDLSDDVLLYILRHCSPMDLKALGYSCSRLARLVLERSLWRSVDARSHPSGRARLRWLLAHALHADTTLLLLAGYAREASGCLGHVTSTRKSEEREMEYNPDQGAPIAETNPAEPVIPAALDLPFCARRRLHHHHHARFQISAHQLPRFSGSPCWPEEVENDEAEVRAEDSHTSSEATCSGPQFTLSAALLRQLEAKCPNLTTLGLEYCNINCKTTGISQFPSTLKELSLRGSKCFNLPMDKSFLFKIQDYLPDLETVDVSECEWLEPSSLLPLSKLRILRRLLARDCVRLSEFVAYASLASRYGFRELTELDLRGCPVGDSEVSALGWLPALRVLRLAAAGAAPCRDTHRHSKPKTSPSSTALDSWELQEPEYFISKLQSEMESAEVQRSNSDPYVNDCTPTQLNPREYAQNGEEDDILSVGRSIEEGNGIAVKSPTKRKPEDGSGDSAEINGEEPSCSKRMKVDIGEGDSTAKKRRDSDSSDDDTPKKKSRRDTVKISVIRKKGSLSVQFNNGNCKDENVDNKKINNDIMDDSGSEAQEEGSENSKNEDAKTEKEDTNNLDKGRSVTHKLGISKMTQKGVNAGASTSNKPNESKPVRGFVCFRRNRESLFHEVAELQPQPQVVVQAEPLHRVLYVNFGQPNQIMYGYPRPMNFVSERVNVFNPSPPHLDSSSLVSDSSVRRFGRANDEDINYVHIGPNGPIPGNGESSSRPDRSSLRTLSMVGYRHITDRSLAHLATAAPHLQFVDFRGTSVTTQGVDNFKTLRPDCVVRFGELKDGD